MSTVTDLRGAGPLTARERAREGIRRYGPLFRNLVRREVRQRYKGSILGLTWSLVQPAVMVVAYYFVFKYIWRVTIPNYWLLLIVGLTIWTFFFGGALSGAGSFVSNSNLVTKVSFPRAIIPLGSMTANAVIAGAMLAVAFPLCMFFTGGERETIVLLPVFVLFLAMLTAGLGLALSVLNVYFRDVEHILAAIGLPWIFVSPIFWTPVVFEQVAPGLKGNPFLVDLLYYANPPAPFIIAIQKILFFGVWPSLTDFAYCAIVGTAALAIGWLIFRRMQRDLAIEL